MPSATKPTHTPRSPREEAERSAEQLRADPGHLLVRVLDDDSIAAVVDLLYTRSIFLGVDHQGNWDRRYCFQDRTLAVSEFYKLKSEDDVPTGFISQRPKPYGEL